MGSRCGLTLVAGIGHRALGSIAGSLPGIVIGSYFSVRVPDVIVCLMLAVTLILAVGKLVL